MNNIIKIISILIILVMVILTGCAGTNNDGTSANYVLATEEQKNEVISKVENYAKLEKKDMEIKYSYELDLKTNNGSRLEKKEVSRITDYSENLIKTYDKSVYSLAKTTTTENISESKIYEMWYNSTNDLVYISYAVKNSDSENSQKGTYIDDIGLLNGWYLRNTELNWVSELHESLLNILNEEDTKIYLDGNNVKVEKIGKDKLNDSDDYYKVI